MDWKSIVVIGLGVVLASPALAHEKAVTKAEVPKAVLDAAAARYPEAEMTRFAQEEEAGRTVFEVQLDLDGGRTELIVSPEGEILTEEATISMKELPAAVRQGLSSSRHSKAKVLKIERVTQAGPARAPTYEVFVRNDNTRYELVFSSAGALTKEVALREPAH